MFVRYHHHQNEHTYIACWHFAVDDAAPSRHPLHIACLQMPFMPTEVLVIERALKEIAHCLKAAVKGGEYYYEHADDVER